MKKLVIGTALLITALPFTFDGVTPTISKAQAVIGRPLTPGSIAGVHRRAMRRTYGVGANLHRPFIRRPVLAAAAVGATAYGTGWGGGWGGWGWNRPLFASAVGVGGPGVGMGGGVGMIGGAFCYPTFDYSTGWNAFCPGTGFAFGTGQIHQ
jgi:hypothetical protein